MIQGGRGQMSKRQAVASTFLLRIRTSCNERPTSQDQAGGRSHDTKINLFLRRAKLLFERTKKHVGDGIKNFEKIKINKNENRNYEIMQDTYGTT